MAKLRFTDPPESLEGKRYSFYRDWLNINFYEQLCSYCLLQFKACLEIEHYEPQSYAPELRDDPANLLLGCPKCNNGKLDYHPEHGSRRRLPISKENRGFSVIDIREEDFSDLFELEIDGELKAKHNSNRERVKFNIVDLLRLNAPSHKKMRARCIKYVNACEAILSKGSIEKEDEQPLNVLIELCAERHLFYRAFDITLSDVLTTLIDKYLAENKPQLVT